MNRQGWLRLLDRLVAGPLRSSGLWLDEEGRVQGRFHCANLTSVFQPMRSLATGMVRAHEAYAHSYSEADSGLSIWKLLDEAADDHESMYLDRLCRVLHSVNFFRQQAPDDVRLFLSVDARLLAAVREGHGRVFRALLDILEIDHRRLVLQLPPAQRTQSWLLHEIESNYQRHGFSVACTVSDISSARELLTRLRPQVLKIDARGRIDTVELTALLIDAHRRGVELAFKRIDQQAIVDQLLYAHERAEGDMMVQGFQWDLPAPSLNMNPGLAGRDYSALPSTGAQRSRSNASSNHDLLVQRGRV